MTKVIRFSAAWCGPCKMLAPTFEQLEKEFGDVEFETIDIDGNRDTVVEYDVRTVPTVIFEQNGVVVDKLVGLHSKDEYLNKIYMYNPST